MGRRRSLYLQDCNIEDLGSLETWESAVQDTTAVIAFLFYRRMEYRRMEL